MLHEIVECECSPDAEAAAEGAVRAEGGAAGAQEQDILQETENL